MMNKDFFKFGMNYWSQAKDYNFLIKFNFIFHTTNSLIDMLIYSYGGQILMDSAKSVCDENERIDKNYVFLLMRAQSEIKIDTGFFSATLPTFCTILNRVMSLITLLQSFI